MSMLALLRCRRGAAAAEMALVTPLLVLMLAGGVEVGYYFYAEHRLVEGVRDAARYAGRQSFNEYAACSGSPSSTLVANARLLAAKGSLNSSDPDKLWGWGETGEDFTLTISCTTTATSSLGTETLSGIYKGRVDGAPVVTVHATLPHQSVLAAFGFRLPLELNATQQASVMGV